MSELNLDFVKKGISEPREGLRDQGVVSTGLGRKYETELAGSGWTAEDTAEIETLTSTLGSRTAEQAEAKIAAKSATVNEQDAKSYAKEIIGKVRLGASVVLSKIPIPNVTKESFESGGPLARSTAKISMYLEKILPAVKSMDEHLKTYFGGKSPSTLVAEVLKNLDIAQSAQEVSLSSMPRETLEIYETKGRLLTKIEELNKVAKIAFWGQSDITSQFNKDILNRARKSRKKPEGEAATKEKP